MKSRDFLTSLGQSPIGYGCYGLSGAYGGKVTEDEMIRLIQQAYSLGVRFFDTADRYGETEQVLGKAIGDLRQQVIIATKVGMTDQQKPNLKGKYIRQACESSLQNLQTDYLDLYQVHYDDPQTPISETVEALEELKKEGLIRHYGIGHLPLERTEEYLQLGDVATVLIEMNALAMGRYRQLAQLQQKYDFGLIGFSVTARGLLTGKVKEGTQFAQNDLRAIDPLFQRARLTSGLRVAEKLREMGHRWGKSPVQVAIAWVVQQPGVQIALTGPTQLEHVKENLAGLNWHLEEKDLHELGEFLNREEINLQRVISEELFQILQSPLDIKFDQAVNDLIYVLENGIEGELLDYKVGIEYYLKLLQIKREGQKDLIRLDEIRQALKNAFRY